jgi:hypothetical protein
MRPSYAWLATAVVFFGTAEASAQTYTIKINARDTIGTTRAYRETSSDGGWLRFFRPDGKLALEDNKSKNRALVYSETILEGEGKDGRLGKFKIVYENARETVDGKPRPLSYHGRTLIFERKDGTYRVGVVGEPPLDPADVEELLKSKSNVDDNRDWSFVLSKAFVPGRPVSVGERWQLDRDLVARLFPKPEFEADPEGIRAEAKLLKVYTRGGSQFGVLEATFELSVRSLGKGSKFDPSGVMKQTLTLDTAIDGADSGGSFVYKGLMTGKGVIAKGKEVFGTEMRMEQVSRLECSEAKHDPKALEVPAVKFVGAGEWIEYTSKEGRFTASFPAKPTLKTKKAANGTVTSGVTVTREHEKVVYMVMFIDYPEDQKPEPKTALKDLVARLGKSAEAAKEINRAGHAGIESVFDIEQTGTRTTWSYQAFFVNGRLYQLMAGGDPGMKDRVEVRKFFDSFRLEKAKAEGADGKGEIKR